MYNSIKRDWTSLPDLVWFLILDKFLESKDVVQFGLVCKQWHLVSKDYIDMKRNLQQKALPMLLIPTKRGRKKKTRKLYCTIEEKFICSVPVGSNRKFCGSSYGWLAYNDENGDITLVNPFENKRRTIQLPRLNIAAIPNMKTKSYWYDVVKLVLSADPTLCPQSYVVVVIFGCYQIIGYIKAGQQSWTMIDNGIFNKKLTIFIDAIFYKGLVYAVTYHGKVICFDIAFDHPPTVKVLVDKGSKFINKVYLVESSKGELLLVERYYDDWTNWTKTFKLYKLVIEDGHFVDKVELKSIGGDALFIGHNYSMSVSDLNFLENRRDSIYFTDDFRTLWNFDGDRDIGIFNIRDGSRKHLYAYKPSQRGLPPVLWIVPPFMSTHSKC